MVNLGEFGAAQRELSGEADDFVFFGETFGVVGMIPAVLMLQLGAAVTGKIEEQEGYAAMWEALRCSLTRPAIDDKPADEAQFTKLYKLAVEKACDEESLMRLVFTLFEAQSGRPTRQPSVSSDGPSTTSPSSSDSSTPVVPSHLRSVDDLIKGNVIQLGDGQMVEVEYGPPPTEQTG